MASKKPNAGGKSGMNVDTALVRELAELLNETGLTEIEVEDDDRKIRVARGGGSIVAAPAVAAPAAAPGGSPWKISQPCRSRRPHRPGQKRTPR